MSDYESEGDEPLPSPPDPRGGRNAVNPEKNPDEMAPSLGETISSKPLKTLSHSQPKDQNEILKERVLKIMFSRYPNPVMHQELWAQYTNQYGSINPKTHGLSRTKDVYKLFEEDLEFDSSKKLISIRSKSRDNTSHERSSRDITSGGNAAQGQSRDGNFTQQLSDIGSFVSVFPAQYYMGPALGITKNNLMGNLAAFGTITPSQALLPSGIPVSAVNTRIPASAVNTCVPMSAVNTRTRRSRTLSSTPSNTFVGQPLFKENDFPDLNEIVRSASIPKQAAIKTSSKLQTVPLKSDDKEFIAFSKPSRKSQIISSKSDDRDEVEIITFSKPKVSATTQTVGPPKCFMYEPLRTWSEDIYHYQRQRHINREQLNVIADEMIARLSEANEFVSPNAVEHYLLQRIQRNNLRDVGLRNITDLDSVRNLMRSQGKVSAYIQAYMMVRSVCTLYDLQTCMKEFVRDGESFSDLQLGPLTKQPLVYQYFKVKPTESEPLEITTIDVIRHLRDYLNKHSLWMQRVTIEGLMEYLVEVYHVDDPYDMTVVIKSLPLVMQVLKKATRDEAKMVRDVKAAFEEDLKIEIKTAFNNFRDKFLSKKGNSSEFEIRAGYLEMSSLDLISDLNGKLSLLLASLAARMNNCRSLQRSKRALNDFLNLLREDELLRDVMQLAVCVGCQGFSDTLLDRMFPSIEANKEADININENKTLPPPPLEKLLGSLHNYLERCSSHGALSLEMLSKVEDRLCQDFNRDNFNRIGYGSFLNFLVQQPEAKRVFEELGGSSLSVGNSFALQSIYKPSLSDLLDLLSQCALKNDMVEAVVCDHYNVLSIKTLGYGSLDSIMAKGERQSKTRDHNIAYESALCPQVSQSRNCRTERKVGILGHQTKENALACLQSCPLMVNLEEWSNWSQVFQPELGSLKHFIQKYGGTHHHIETSFAGLEVSPGLIIKITSTTSEKHFSDAAKDSDVMNTCGHLVSLLVRNQGVAGAPLSLLANSMVSVLHQIQGHTGRGDNGAMFRSDDNRKVVEFVRDCLMALPTRIAIATANQIFLEPFSKVVGDAKSKQLLLESCETASHFNKLITLGMSLGINEWVKAFQERFVSPATKTTIDKANSDSVMYLEEDVESEVSGESESDDDSYESEDLIILDEILSADDEKPAADTDKSSEHAFAGKLEDEDIVKSDDNLPTETGAAQQEEATVEDIKPDDFPDEMAHLSSQERDCFNIVNCIRRDEFGVGVLLSEDAEKLMRVQHERLGRSLERLSRDLYTRDTHFVLELVQNADDNSYPEKTSKSKRFMPAMQFIIETDSVTILNNECGFEKKHMKALCDVGNSTKGKHKFGYIGQKGIGFKSVFRVTDRPEVHSNGFHVCFDATSGPTGYILPHWVEDKTTDNTDKWTTTIFLPIKPSQDDSSYTASLAHRFHDIQSSLLLFLHRLRSISIINKIEGTNVEMQRKDVGKNVIEIRHSGATEKWLVVKKQIDASKISLQAKSGVDIESTEIALAFKLMNKTPTIKTVPEKQQVFAFLPLRSYGFRFIIQGDFDVPSSREDVDRDSPWNQWLRSKIPLLFLEALESFKGLASELDGVKAVTRFLQFVPLEDEIVDPFFRPVAMQIHQNLKSQPCLPTQPTPDGDIEWKLPSEVVVCEDCLVHDVISAKLLHQHLGLLYLHEDIASVISCTMLQSLGVQTLSSQHILDIGKSIAVEWEQMQHFSDDDVLKLAKWLVCIHRSLDEFHDNSSIVEQIRAMRIYPLTNGKLISLTQAAVFFPQIKKKQSQTSIYGEIPNDVNILNMSVLDCLDDVANPQIKRMLEELGVKQLNPSDVIHHHILPNLKSLSAKDIAYDLLISYVIYIKVQMTKDPGIINFSSLHGFIPVKTNHGLKNPKVDSVHFTPVYSSIDLQKCLPGYKWILLDSCYLPSSPRSYDVESWRDFFVNLGVLINLAIKKRELSLTHSELEKSAWAAVAPLVEDQPGPFKITDYMCDEFYALVTDNQNIDSRVGQMRSLYQWISAQFSSLNTKLQTQLYNNLDQPIKTIDTTFSLHLKNLAWIPGHKRQFKYEFGRVAEVAVEEKLNTGKELFLSRDNIKNYLGTHVTYLSIPDPQESPLCQHVGIQTFINANMVKNFLILWCSDVSVITDDIFIANMQHMKIIYNYLTKYLSNVDVQDMFSTYPVIFVPKNDCVMDERQFVAGRFFSADNVCWSDPTALFYQYSQELEDRRADIQQLPMLDAYYPCGMQEFFVTQGKVAFTPTFKQYFELMECIAMSIHEEKRFDILHCLTYISMKVFRLQDQEEEEFELLLTDLKTMLTKLAVIPVKGRKFVSLEQKPMFADDKLEKEFRDKEGIYFIDLDVPGNKMRHTNTHKSGIKIDSEHLTQLFTACKLQNLSDCLVSRSETEALKPCPSVQFYIHQLIPHIQIYLSQKYDEVYQGLTAMKMAAKLKIMKFYQVRKLEVVYSIKHAENIAPYIQNEKCRISESMVYISEQHVNSHSEINKELANFFSQKNKDCFSNLRIFLNDIMIQLKDNKIGKFDDMYLENSLEDKIPEGDEKWFIDPPEVVIPIQAAVPKKLPQPSQQSKIGTTASEPAGFALENDQLRSWPPGPPAGFARNLNTERRANPTATMWPPPRPAESTLLRPKSPIMQDQTMQLSSRTSSPSDGSDRSSHLQKTHGFHLQQGQPGFPLQQGQPGFPLQQGQHGFPLQQGQPGFPLQQGQVGKPCEGAGGFYPHMSGLHTVGSHNVTYSGNPPSESILSKGEGRTGIPISPGSVKRDMDVSHIYPPAKRSRSAEDVTGTLSGTGGKVVDRSFSGPKSLEDQVIYSESEMADRKGMESTPTVRENSSRNHPSSSRKFRLTADNYQIADDTIYEDLSVPELPKDIADRREDGNEQMIGTLGELLVYRYLQSLDNYNNKVIKEVIWLNEQDELGLPYDFVLNLESVESSSNDLERHFIEVKATQCENKEVVEISLQQIECAAKLRENYDLFRVYSLGSADKIRLCRIANLADKMEKKQVRLCVVV